MQKECLMVYVNRDGSGEPMQTFCVALAFAFKIISIEAQKKFQWSSEWLSMCIWVVKTEVDVYPLCMMHLVSHLVIEIVQVSWYKHMYIPHNFQHIKSLFQGLTGKVGVKEG